MKFLLVTLISIVSVSVSASGRGPCSGYLEREYYSADIDVTASYAGNNQYELKVDHGVHGPDSSHLVKAIMNGHGECVVSEVEETK